MCTSKSEKFLAQAEKMQPLATLVPAFKAIGIGIESRCVVIVSVECTCEV